MRLTLRRSGGLLGSPTPPVTVDTTRLPDAQQKRVEDLVRAADFFALPPSLQAEPSGPDRFQYDLEVRDAAGRMHRVSYGEEAAPDALLELSRVLRGVAAGESSQA
jgi:hypothetical protein